MLAQPLWKLSRIMIDLGGSVMILLEDIQETDRFLHGTVRQGQIDLTYAEAETLLKSLQLALQSCQEMDRFVEEDFADETTPVPIYGAPATPDDH